MNASELTEKFKTLFMGPQELVGVDIGSHAVKVVWLTSGDKTCRLNAWAHAPLQFGADATPEERKLVTARLIKDIFDRKKIPARTVALSVSGNAVIVRYVAIPRISRKDMAVMLPTEAEPFIPFDIKDVQLGYHILGDVVEDNQKKMQIVLVADKKEVVGEKMDVASAAGLSPLVIDVDAFALEAVADRLPRSGAGALVLLNIGHKTTNLAIIEKGVTRVARDIPIAGNAFTRTISKQLNVELAQAEEIKRRVGIKLTAAVTDSSGELSAEAALDERASAIISEIAHDLCGEVRRSVDFYISQEANRAVEKVLLCGGASAMPNLASLVSADMKVPVEPLSPVLIMAAPAEPVPPEIAPSLTVACGLALRKLWDWQ